MRFLEGGHKQAFGMSCKDRDDLYSKGYCSGGINVVPILLQLTHERTATSAVFLDNLCRPADEELWIEHAIEVVPDRLLCKPSSARSKLCPNAKKTYEEIILLDPLDEIILRALGFHRLNSLA